MLQLKEKYFREKKRQRGNLSCLSATSRESMCVWEQKEKKRVQREPWVRWKKWWVEASGDENVQAVMKAENESWKWQRESERKGDTEKMSSLFTG